METDVKPAAESSTAATVVETPAFDPSDQYTWSSEQREQWGRTGDIPESPTKQESAPADEKKSAATGKKAESKPAEESATSQTQEKESGKPHKGSPAPKRAAELNDEIKQLLKKRADLLAEIESVGSKKDAKPAESSTAKPTDAKPADAPKRPNPFTFKGTPEEWEAEQEKWESHLQQQAAARYAQQQRLASEQQTFQQQLDDGRKRYSDFETVIKPAVAELTEAAVKGEMPVVIQQALNGSPHLVDVLYVLGGDQAGLKDFLATAKADPAAAMRKLFFVEQEVAKELAKGKAAAEGEKKPEASAEKSGEKEKPPVEPKPRAPRPPSEVGGRGAAGTDALVAAAEANDFLSFDKEMTRRQAARLGIGQG